MCGFARHVMPPARTSFHELARIAEVAARAPHFVTALETVVREVGRVFQTEAYAIEEVNRSWSVAATTPHAPPLSRTLLELVTVPDSYAPLTQRDAAGAEWAVISLATSGAPRVALLLAGSWQDSYDLLSEWARLTAFAIGASRERDLRTRAEELLTGGYATARRLSRLGSVDAVAQRIVDEVSRMVDAGRVSLALHRPADDFLTIVATHGYAMSAVEQIRIQPGDWVIGHVYSKGRPVLVRDVRRIHGMAHEHRGYRSFSFAAVPIFAGSTTIGVLTATDKRDNSSFDRQDFVALRTMSVVAGMALVAARSQTEAGRLAYAATVDSLTGLLNRTYLDGRLHQEFERAKRAGTQLAVVMGDVDDFKTINDTHGHQIGDAVLQVVGAIIRSAVRVFDVCARYGGDEFAIRDAKHRPRERRGLRRTDPAARLGIPRRSGGADSAHADDERGGGGDRGGRYAGGSAPPRRPRPLSGEGRRQELRSHSLAVGGRPSCAAGLEPQGARLMSSVDANAWTLPDPPGGDPNRVELPYVLVADTNVERAAMCLDAIRPFKAGVLVARDGEEAARILERFGPPILLIVDLSLARRDGFAVIEGLRAQRLGRTEIIAWAAFRELSEFAAQRLSGLNVRVLRGGAPADVVQAAVERAFERHSSAASPADVVTMPSAEELHEIMAALAEKAQHLARTPGVAVYLRAPAATQFRASVTWTSDSPIPHSPYYIPRVFGWILETGESLVLPDLATQPLSDVPMSTLQDVVRGLVAVPIIGPNGQTRRDHLRLRSQAARSERPRRGCAEGPGPVGDVRQIGAAGCRGRRAAMRRPPNQSPHRFPGLRRAAPTAPSRALSSRRVNRHHSRRYRCSIGSMESSPPPASSRVPAGKSARSA